MTDSDSHFSSGGTDSAIRHARDDAPSEREFELLYQGTHDLSGDFAIQCRFVLIAGGRLGMRPGEIAHFRNEWVDWHNSRIEIPAYDPCDKGREGGVCGYCKQCARGRVEYNPSLDAKDALEQRWHPKTESAIRSIPFDFSERTELVIDQFCERYDRWPHSRQSINRRVERFARASEVDADGLYPHALRSHSATYHAGRGVGALALKSFHGWSELSTAQLYLSESPANTQRAVRSAHSR